MFASLDNKTLPRLDPILREANRKSRKLSSFEKLVEKYGDTHKLYEMKIKVPDRVGFLGEIRDNYAYFSKKTYFATPH